LAGGGAEAPPVGGLLGPDTLEEAADMGFDLYGLLRVFDLLKQTLLNAVIFKLGEVTGGSVALALE
tara:strand:- start:344 stop:541 length:198 start_codon:yes stop_codon:yes gene_type:complete